MPSTISDLIEAAQKAFNQSFSGVIKIDLEDDGLFFVNGFDAPPSIDEKDPNVSEPALCIWRTDMNTLQRILSNERALENAYISGRLAITGDMSIMARLTLEASP